MAGTEERGDNAVCIDVKTGKIFFFSNDIPLLPSFPTISTVSTHPQPPARLLTLG